MAQSNISKNLNLRPQGRLQPDLHISGVAGALFAICLLAGIIGTIVMTTNGIANDVLVGAWVIGWSWGLGQWRG